eukprot:6159316-Pleurochrysis_carterae.AAC.1
MEAAREWQEQEEMFKGRMRRTLYDPCGRPRCGEIKDLAHPAHLLDLVQGESEVASLRLGRSLPFIRIWESASLRRRALRRRYPFRWPPIR